MYPTALPELLSASPDGQARGGEPALGLNIELPFSGGWIWGLSVVTKPS